jgi:hypothetical protein
VLRLSRSRPHLVVRKRVGILVHGLLEVPVHLRVAAGWMMFVSAHGAGCIPAHYFLYPLLLDKNHCARN